MGHCQQQSQIKDVRTEPFTVVVAVQAHCFNLLSRKNFPSWEIPNVMLSGSVSTFHPGPQFSQAAPKECLNIAGGTCSWPFLCNIGQSPLWRVPLGLLRFLSDRHFNSRLLLFNTAFFPLSFQKSGQIFKWENLKDFVAQPPPPPNTTFDLYPPNNPSCTPNCDSVSVSWRTQSTDSLPSSVAFLFDSLLNHGVSKVLI